MRKVTPQAALVCALLLTIWPAFSQTPTTSLPTNADDNSPWGGVPARTVVAGPVSIILTRKHARVVRLTGDAAHHSTLLSGVLVFATCN